MGSPGSRFEIIHEVLSQTDNRLSVTALCRIAGVSRSGYYNWVHSADTRAKREARDRADFERILEAYNFRGYEKGAQGIHMRLLHENPPVVQQIHALYQ